MSSCPQQILAFELVPFNYSYMYLLSLSDKLLIFIQILDTGFTMNLIKYPPQHQKSHSTCKMKI
jgi:hypothetical protein